MLMRWVAAAFCLSLFLAGDARAQALGGTIDQLFAITQTCACFCRAGNGQNIPTSSGDEAWDLGDLDEQECDEKNGTSCRNKKTGLQGQLTECEVLELGEEINLDAPCTLNMSGPELQF